MEVYRIRESKPRRHRTRVIVLNENVNLTIRGRSVIRSNILLVPGGLKVESLTSGSQPERKTVEKVFDA